MGSQFKRPFSVSGKPLPKEAPSSRISEQNTLRAPAVSMPPAPNTPPDSMPPQGYVQGQHGQYGPRPSNQPFKSAGQFDGPPANQLFSGPQQGGMQQMSGQSFGGQQGGMQTSGQSFGGQQGGMQQMSGQSFGGQQGGMQANSLFAGVQAPPVTPMGRSGTAFEPQAMGVTPAPNWAGQRSATRGLPEKPASLRGREKSREGLGKKGKKKRRVPIWARVMIGILLFLVVLIGTGFTYYQVNFANTVNTITGKQFVRAKGETDPNEGKSGSVLNWGRVNILLLGSDTDEKANFAGNSFLAQTVIVASVDTSTHEVDMLSIPRDYYIPIPGYRTDKLDTAFAYGGSINNNMSGVGTVVNTLDQDFGIKINFYAWVGLQGFIKVINTVGGVDVNVIHPVVDDTYPDDISTTGKSQLGYGYRRVYVPDGPQHLDGPSALDYVRSRHSTTDFDRSARQQQVLSALRLKLDNAGIFGELSQIATDLQGYLYTSLSPAQLLDLGNFARGIDANKIKHLTLGGTKYSTSGQVKNGTSVEDVVYPNCGTVPAAINTFLHITTAVCNVSANSGEPVPALASSSGGSASGVVATSTLASASGLADAGLGLGSDAETFSNLFGMRDLLDLMSMVVLDSPQA